jgi:putative hydrolase of the HAD superfamily
VNLVFDLGGVVVRWDPDAIISSVFADSGVRSAVREHIFSHADWLALDRGTLALEEAIDRAAARSGLGAAAVRRLLDAVPPSLVPIPESVDLLHRLHARGHALFCLSNIGHASIEHLERTHEFFGLFTGKVVSCRVNACKPEPAIYRHLLDGFALAPERTVFIDDVEANVAAAAKLGMLAIRFESAAQCERELAAFLAR